MNRLDIFKILLIVILSLFALILLDQNYYLVINSFLFVIAFTSIFIGISNSIHYLYIDMGITRKKLANNFIKNLSLYYLFAIVYFCLICLFSSILYNNTFIFNEIILLKTTLMFLFSIFLSLIFMLSFNLFYSLFNKNHFNIILFLIILFLIIGLLVFLLINKMFLFIIIVLSVFSIILFVLNYRIILNIKI